MTVLVVSWIFELTPEGIRLSRLAPRRRIASVRSSSEPPHPDEHRNAPGDDQYLQR
jgi:hypothetical protein